MKQPRVGEPKLIFYPMVVGKGGQTDSLRRTLRWILEHSPTRREVEHWIQTQLRSGDALNPKYALNIFTVLLSSTGLVRTDREGICRLTEDGRSVVAELSNTCLLRVFSENFVGIAEIFELLQRDEFEDIPTLRTYWYELTASRFITVRRWKDRNTENQFRTRLNWLRSVGAVAVSESGVSLTSDGMDFVAQHSPDLLLISSDEIRVEESQVRETASASFTLFDTVRKHSHQRTMIARNRAFRNVVLNTYDCTCIVCGLRLRTPDDEFETQASHIVPKHRSGSDDPRNGIALCRTHHWAFDRGLFTITPESCTVLISSFLRNEERNPSAEFVLQFGGRPIREAFPPKFAPHIDALRWHNSTIFLDMFHS